MPVDQLVSTLVERLRFPTRDARGATLTYQLHTVADGRPLPCGQRFLDLHIPSGTSVYLDVDEASRPTVPVSARQPLVPLFWRMDRRVALSLITASVAGALTGISTAVAQRVRGGSGRTPPVQQRAVTIRQQFRLTAHTATVRALAWSPDGTTLASGADNAVLLLWRPDGTVKQRVLLPDTVRSLSWSPGGERIAAASGTVVAFIQAQTGQVLALPRAHLATVTSVSWSAHAGSPVVSGSLDRRALVWQTQDYRPRGMFTKHTAAIDAVAAAPGDSTIVASSSEGGLIRMWDLGTLQEVHGFSQDAPMLSVAFAPDGVRLAVGGQDGIVRVWENGVICQRSVPIGGELRCTDVPLRLRGHTAAVRTLAWSPDGRYLASGSDDQSVILWDSTTHFTQVAQIIHTGPIAAIAWSRDPQILASASRNSVQLWRLQV